MKSPKSKKLRCLDILQGIKAGTTDPTSLVRKQRKLLVPFLMAEGQSTAEIAHLLQVSDRTIERYKKAIRRKNAISLDPELVKIIVGQLVNEAQTCIQRIRKVERDADCPPAARIEGERGCFQILNSLAERLQSMGYLPTAAKKLEAELNHNMKNTLSLEEIGSEAQRLKAIDAALPENQVKKIESKEIVDDEDDDD